jgi:hypothetical protein
MGIGSFSPLQVLLKKSMNARDALQLKAFSRNLSRQISICQYSSETLSLHV